MTRWRGWAVAAGMLCAMGPSAAEDVTVSTYYPSPRGVYRELRTSGDVHIGSMAAPSARLHVEQAGPTVAFRVDDEAGDLSPFTIDQDGNVGVGGSRILTDGFDGTNMFWFRTGGPEPSSVFLGFNGTPGGLANSVVIAPQGTPGIFVSNLGGVGIGMATPLLLGRLEVRGDLALDTDAPDGPAVRLFDDSGTPWELDHVSGRFRVFHGVTEALTILSNGNVGIGTTNPGAPLYVTGTTVIDGATAASESLLVVWGHNGLPGTRIRLNNSAAGGRMYSLLSTGGTSGWGQGKFIITDQTGGGVIDNPRLTIDPLGNVGIGTTAPTEKFFVNGSIGASGAKLFDIPHPSKPGMRLVHASVEAPEQAVVYRGEAQLTEGAATIALPEYFEALTRPEGRTVQLTAVDGYSPLYVDAGIAGGQFVVRTTEDGHSAQRFFWQVTAVRADLPPLEAERRI